MATTTGGSTYVTSTDLVANYPTASLALANRVDLVASGEIVYNTGNYTITVADILGGKTIIQDSASATTVTLPSSSLVNGMQAKISNVGAGTVTVSGGTLLGTATINQYGGITAVYKTSITSWWLLPFSGSVGAANFTNTATGTYTGYKYVTFTGNGSLVIDKAGFADFLVIGGGAGGGANYGGGGGAGAHLYRASQYIAAGTYTVVVGGGGAGSASQTTTGGQGNISYVDYLSYGIAAPGGGGGGALTAGNFDPMSGAGGGSGGGSSGYGRGFSAPPGIGVFAGSNGGSGATTAGGGGGGAGAVGTNASGNNGGAGGAGTANSITNSAVTRAGGGGGGGVSSGGAAGSGGGGAGGAGGNPGAAGTANTGGGGGGGAGSYSGAGGSGLVSVRVAV